MRKAMATHSSEWSLNELFTGCSVDSPSPLITFETRAFSNVDTAEIMKEARRCLLPRRRAFSRSGWNSLGAHERDAPRQMRNFFIFA